MLVHPKDRVIKNQKYGIAYKITCRNCKKIYVRQTCHSVNQRITEHKRALSSLDFNMSAVAEHAIKKITILVGRILRFWTVNRNYIKDVIWSHGTLERKKKQ